MIEQDSERDFPLDEAEPYGSRAEALHQDLIHLVQAWTRYDNECNDQIQQLDKYHSNLLIHPWFVLWVQPHQWRDIQAHYQSIAKTLEVDLGKARSKLEGLKNLPVETAHWTQRLERISVDSLGLVHKLRQVGIHGDKLNQTSDSVKTLQNELRSLPDYFFITSNDEVLRQVTKDEVKRVWPILDTLSSAIEARFQELQQWLNRYRELGEALQVARKQMQEAKVQLEKIPAASVDIEDHLDRLKGVGEDLLELEDQYHKLAVEAFELFGQAVTKVTSTTGKLIGQAQEIQRWFGLLREAIIRNTELLTSLEGKMAQSLPTERYAVNWGPYQDKLAKLRQTEQAIGNLKQQRTPDQLKPHFNQTQALTKEVEKLTNFVSDRLTQRPKLIPLLERSELLPQIDWVRAASDLEVKIRVYAPENWPHHQVQTIGSTAQALEERRQQLLPSYVAGGRLSWEWLTPSFVSSVAELVGKLEAFSQRLEEIKRRLAQIQTQEQIARQELDSTNQAIERLLTELQKTNLSQTSSKIVDYMHKLRELQHKEGQELIQALKRQNEGQVDQKASQVKAWVREKCMAALKDLVQQIQTAIKAAEAGLQKQVDELEKVASFARESAMYQAKDQLKVKRPSKLSLKEAPDGDLAVYISDLVDRVIMGQRQEWAKLSGCGEQLRSEIEEPIRTPQSMLTEAQQKFNIARGELSDAIGSKWPVLECDTRRMDEQLQKDKEALRYSQTVREVKRQMEISATHYKEAQAELQARISQLEQDRRVVQEVLAKIENWKKMLQRYRDLHPDGEITAVIEGRLGEIERALTKAKSRYGHKPVPCAEIRRTLQQVLEKGRQDLWLRQRGQFIRARDIENEVL